MFARTGPRRIFLPAFPKKPAAGIVKAQGSYQRFGVPNACPAVGHGSIPFDVDTPLVILLLLRPGARSGRSIPAPALAIADRDRFAVRATVKGLPVWSDTMPLACQPFTTFPSTPAAGDGS